MRGPASIGGERIAEALKQEIYTVADLRAVVTHEEAIDINRYHLENLQNLGTIISSPMPADQTFHNPIAKEILPNNRTRYDQGLESDIISDEIIKALKAAKKNSLYGNPENIVPAIRTRRSIVALLFRIPEFSSRG